MERLTDKLFKAVSLLKNRLDTLESKTHIKPVVINGVDGKDGTNGRDGVDGKDGRDGVDGKDGRDGVDGITPDIDDVIAQVFSKLPTPKSVNLQEVVDAVIELIPNLDIELVAKTVIDRMAVPTDGRDGVNGKDGRNGKNGKDGKSITDVQLKNGILYVWIDGKRRRAGKINIPFTAGGGGSSTSTTSFFNGPFVGGFRYQDDDNEPADGKIVFTGSEVRISKLTNNSDSVDYILKYITKNNTFFISNDNESVYRGFTVFGHIIDHGTYFSIPVTLDNSVGNFSDGDELVVSVAFSRIVEQISAESLSTSQTSFPFDFFPQTKLDHDFLTKQDDVKLLITFNAGSNRTSKSVVVGLYLDGVQQGNLFVYEPSDSNNAIDGARIIRVPSAGPHNLEVRYGRRGGLGAGHVFISYVQLTDVGNA